MNKLQQAWNDLSGKIPEDRRIIINQIKTPDGTIIVSLHRHDYVSHRDANGYEYSVDGGTEYLKRSVHPSAPPAKEMSVYDDAPFSLIRQHYSRGGRGKNGDQPLKWVPMEKMSDAWLKACIEYNIKLGNGNSFANVMYRRELGYRVDNKITVEDVE